MTDVQQKAAAKQFVKDWLGHGDEKQETQSFWLAFLRDVFGVEKPEEMIKFEVPVKLSHSEVVETANMVHDRFQKLLELVLTVF